MATKKPRSAKRTRRTPARPDGHDWALDFLPELTKSGVIKTAARKAKVTRTVVYGRLQSDPEFAKAFADAMEDAGDDIEESARKRAKGKSDKLAMYFLNLRYRPHEGKKRGSRLHLHLHQHQDVKKLERKYEEMPADEFDAQYQREVEKLSSATENNPEMQAKELVTCKRNIVRWCNTWLWTYDPRLSDSFIPFDLFPKQAEFLLWLGERETLKQDGLVEKSRDMGVTYLCCAFALHRWLFRDGFAAGFGSRKLELVDRLGDMDSIFEKIRFMLRELPAWMTPEGFDWHEHSNLARLINPENGSSLTGEGGDNIGRGGRKGMYFVDEAAFLERPALVDRSLLGNTEVRIDVSTPNGPGNPFAVKRFGGKVKVFVLDWRDDPRKNQAWYERMKSTKDAVAVAQEIDRDYTASIEGIAIPAAWVRAVGLRLKADARTVCGLDVGELGPDLSVLIGRSGPVVASIESWGRCNTTETAYRARDAAVKLRAVEVCYDAGGPGAGVHGVWGTTDDMPFAAIPVNFGGSPTDDRWPDGQTSKEKCLNLRAEMYWKLRARFEKAYEFREKGVKHPPAEMISLPNHPQLIAELSLPLAERTSTGKIKLESKDDMRRRGVKSPNFADALALAFHASDGVPWTDTRRRGAANLSERGAAAGVWNDPTAAVDPYQPERDQWDDRDDGEPDIMRRAF